MRDILQREIRARSSLTLQALVFNVIAVVLIDKSDSCGLLAFSRKLIATGKVCSIYRLQLVDS